MRRERIKRAFAAVAIGVIACLLVGVLRVRNFPLDDTYIHLSYGLDFTPGSMFSFQAFRRDTGTSSWLWTALCVLVVRLRLPEYPVLTAVAVAIFCGILHGTMEVVARVLPAALPLRWLYVAALLVAADGNVLWLSLTGMETRLSVLLLLYTIPRLLDGRGMTMVNGLLALVWTRIEGVIWLGAAAALLPMTAPRGRRRAWRAWLLPLAGISRGPLRDRVHDGGGILPLVPHGRRPRPAPAPHRAAQRRPYARDVDGLRRGCVPADRAPHRRAPRPRLHARAGGRGQGRLGAPDARRGAAVLVAGGAAPSLPEARRRRAAAGRPGAPASGAMAEATPASRGARSPRSDPRRRARAFSRTPP